MILILGATGMLGHEICQQLTDLGYPVRAMVRTTSDPIKKDKLERMGVQLAVGDLREPSTFKPVLKGVNTVISTVSAMPFSYVPDENTIENVDFNGIRNFIDTAEGMDVAHFIYISASRNFAADVPLLNAKRRVENHLKQSGLAYTILSPSCFSEVWLSPAVGFDAANGKVNVYGEGTNPISYISYVDVARFAVQSVTNIAARNRDIQLGGPEAISQLDAVRIFEAASGRAFEVQHVPLSTLIAQKEMATDPMEKSFAGLMEFVAKGDKIDMTATLRDFPVKMKSVKEFARSMMKSKAVPA